MSKDAHPNINAAGLTVDIITSMINYLRDGGKKHKQKIISSEEIKNEIIDFVACISCKIDKIVEENEGEINGEKE